MYEYLLLNNIEIDLNSKKIRDVVRTSDHLNQGNVYPQNMYMDRVLMKKDTLISFDIQDDLFVVYYEAVNLYDSNINIIDRTSIPGVRFLIDDLEDFSDMVKHSDNQIEVMSSPERIPNFCINKQEKLDQKLKANN